MKEERLALWRAQYWDNKLITSETENGFLFSRHFLLF